MRPLVVAIGNPLRGDDGAAHAAVAGLEAAAPGADVLAVHQLLPEHAEALAAASAAIFVDAREGGRPGELREAELAEGDPPRLGHQLSPGALLAFARALYGRAPPARLLTVSGADFTLGERLSPEVLDALPALRERIAAWAARQRVPPPA